MFIASGFGSGYLPKAPGTWGSAVGVLIWLLAGRLQLPIYAALVAGLFILGVFCSGAAEKILDCNDPGLVVIDEIVGQMIALAAMPMHPVVALAGFALFRFFDILKPFPVGWVDQHLHGGLGIMLDDVLAGIYALIVLQLGWRLYHLLF